MFGLIFLLEGLQSADQSFWVWPWKLEGAGERAFVHAAQDAKGQIPALRAGQSGCKNLLRFAPRQNSLWRSLAIWVNFAIE